MPLPPPLTPVAPWGAAGATLAVRRAMARSMRCRRLRLEYTRSDLAPIICAPWTFTYAGSPTMLPPCRCCASFSSANRSTRWLPCTSTSVALRANLLSPPFSIVRVRLNKSVTTEGTMPSSRDTFWLLPPSAPYSEYVFPVAFAPNAKRRESWPCSAASSIGAPHVTYVSFCDALGPSTIPNSCSAGCGCWTPSSVPIRSSHATELVSPGCGGRTRTATRMRTMPSADPPAPGRSIGRCAGARRAPLACRRPAAGRVEAEELAKTRPFFRVLAVLFFRPTGQSCSSRSDSLCMYCARSASDDTEPHRASLRAKGRAEKNYSGVGSYGEVSTSRTGELGRAPPDLF